MQGAVFLYGEERCLWADCNTALMRTVNRFRDAIVPLSCL
jgi:hypothetical protein